LTGRPSAHRWDCGVLRPSCGSAPVDLNSPGQSLPPGLFLSVPQNGAGTTPRQDLPPIAGPRRGY